MSWPVRRRARVRPWGMAGGVTFGEVFMLVTLGVALALNACATRPPATQPAPPEAWWRGNLHTHTLWTDGNAFPEQVVDWYRDHGYQFVVISDHNVVPAGKRWVPVPDRSPRADMAARYRAAFPDQERRPAGSDTTWIRLRTIAECRRLFDRPGRFLVLPGEEISDTFAGKPVHLTAVNLDRTVLPQHGPDSADLLERDAAAIRRRAAESHGPVLVQVNHPNFYWALTADDLTSAPDIHFFEIYNGSARSYNDGDGVRPGTEAMWDAALSARMRRGGSMLYGVAADDAHNFVVFRPDVTNPGRAWVMVRARALDPSSLLDAMTHGDFYASTGVALRGLSRTSEGIRLAIDTTAGTTYVTEFIGTRRDPGAPAGEILARVAGPVAAYTFRGDELYLRARVVSSRLKANGLHPDEHEMAWIQPAVPGTPIRLPASSAAP